MKKFIFLFVVLLFASCTSIINNYFNKRHEKYLARINETIHVDNCDCNKAKKVADSLFVYNFRFKIKEYDEVFSQNDTSYIFELFNKPIKSYISTEPIVVGIVKGGGGEIVISKKTCKVISIIGYQ